jgi:adenosylcobinamide-GDP ribazoletransferase
MPGPAGAGLRLAVTTLTVLPLRPGRVDRAAGRSAMAVVPLVGVGLGALAAALAVGLTHLGAPPLLTAAVVLGGLAGASRGLHLDGLADTADGLGSHGEPARALAVMRSPEIGALGAVTLLLCLLVQAAALAALVADHRWLGVAAGVAVGRLAISWACRRGVPPARPDGLGALVADSLPVAVPAAWTVVLAAASVPVVDGRPWQGPVAVLIAVAVGVGLVWHVTRRIGGVTGDVLGATCEITAAVTWAVLALTA